MTFNLVCFYNNTNVVFMFFLDDINRIGGVMVSTSNAVDCGFEHGSDQTKDNKIGICCFSARHATIRRKSKDWLAKSGKCIRVGRHVYLRTVVSVS